MSRNGDTPPPADGADGTNPVPVTLPGDEPALDDPALTPYLPLLYVAWADGSLTAEEMRGICARAERAAGDQPCEDTLGRWLDPARPPSARALRRLLTALRRAAAELPEEERRGLAELGAGLARQAGHRPRPEELAALEEIEQALGLGGVPAAALLAEEGERPAAPPAEEAPAFEVAALTRLLDGEHAELRRELRRLLASPELTRPPGVGPRGDRGAYRAWVLDACRVLAERGYGALGYPREDGGRGDRGAFIAAFDTLALGDLSLVVKFGVQFGLFGGSVQMLGTERHHRRYLGPIGRLELPGCFAMSETGHGSNVADLETVARYDAAAGDFELDTPRPAAQKDYIGNAARDGRMATVFAQLEIAGEGYGVHAFLVPIRGDDGEPLPGVEIEDCGDKMGLQGVDNGRLSFHRVRVPRENLLDRFARVHPDGTYESPIPSAGKRFFTMLGTGVAYRF